MSKRRRTRGEREIRRWRSDLDEILEEEGARKAAKSRKEEHDWREAKSKQPEQIIQQSNSSRLPVRGNFPVWHANERVARFSPAFFVSLISAALELTTRAILRTWSLIWLSFDRFARRRTETRKVSCIDINWLNFHLVRLSLSISLSLLFSLFILRFLLFEGPLPFSRNK